ncbi:MAG: YitT family protein [Firmicutes bacterium]|nr:YitT family protein [Bacillota bacterium]MCM1402118.1 YitT family protein [Bacteroides sp.]
MNISHDAVWRTIRDYFFITLGIFIYSFGFSAFIFQEKVVIGGLAGIGTIVYFLTEQFLGFAIPVAVTSFVLNMLLLLCALKIVGWKFVSGTIYGAVMVSVFIGVLTPLFDEPLIQGQSFMNVIIGGLMCGIGVGMAFTHNGSTGGTDIVAAMVTKKTNITVGRTMLYTDMVIISSSYLLFHEIDKVVYGFIILAIASFMADMIINTNRQAVQFIIFSPKWNEIATAINNEAKRGCTVLNGMGWYSKQDVKVLLVMCRKIESVTIFRIIKSIDEHAFITQANVNGVYGQGFDEVKLRVGPKTKDRPMMKGTDAPA